MAAWLAVSCGDRNTEEDDDPRRAWPSQDDDDSRSGLKGGGVGDFPVGPRPGGDGMIPAVTGQQPAAGKGGHGQLERDL